MTNIQKKAGFYLTLWAALLLISGPTCAWSQDQTLDQIQVQEAASLESLEMLAQEETQEQRQDQETLETAFDETEDEAQPVFSFEEVENKALLLATKPFVKPTGARLDFLRKITQDKWRTITFKNERSLWADEHLLFNVGLFHPGSIFDQPPSIFIVDDQEVKPLSFSTDFFNYQDNDLKEKAGRNDLNFAGFRLTYPLHDAEKKDEVAAFLGATHFRGLARHARYGLEARGLILNPAHPNGEEFPYFRSFWLLKPQPEDNSMTVYALLDSPSLTGAYRFIITPGPSTIMAVSARLFQREGHSWPEKIGLAPLGGMYLFSEKEGGYSGDWRPEVHNSDALLWAGSDHNWYRRPLANPKRLEINSFELKSPGGFGLMQQDNNFDHYQDLVARFDLRPSLWVEPVGDWGQGHLELIEIPSTEQINKNIIAYWVPEEKNADHLSYDYKLYWMPSGAIPHQIGRAMNTRLVDWGVGGHHFVIDFEGGQLADLPETSGLASVVETFPGVPVEEKHLVKNPVTGGWRLQFKIKPPDTGVMGTLLSARGDQRVLRVTAVLRKGENLPEPLTETWVYDIPY